MVKGLVIRIRRWMKIRYKVGTLYWYRQEYIAVHGNCFAAPERFFYRVPVCMTSGIFSRLVLKNCIYNPYAPTCSDGVIWKYWAISSINSSSG